MQPPNRLFVKPTAWSTVSSLTSGLPSSIQVFGYTQDRKTVYMRIPFKSTYILRFAEEINEDVINNIKEVMNPTSIEINKCDRTVLILRDPEITPNTLIEDPDYQNLATWIEAKKDPFGELQSFWESKKIGPYEWLSIEKYSPIGNNYTSCDLNIRTDDESIIGLGDIGIEDPPLKILFWDIEVFSSKKDEFPDASNSGDFISLISLITCYGDDVNGYVILKGNVEKKLLDTKYDNRSIISVTTEKELINKFFAIYTSFQPDRDVYHNGDMFDMPYLIDRLNILNIKIPQISKIRALTPWVTRRSYPGPFGREYKPTIIVPGTETIDLIHYYRRFFPHFKNFKLDTIAKMYLGEGKTGLTIEEMMDAVRENNPIKLAKVVEYSYVDSLRMKELWDTSEIQDFLEVVCNNLGINDDMLLRETFDNIIDRVVYNINPGCSGKGIKESPLTLKEPSKGIYRNVHIYDYSQLYRKLMLESGDPVVMELANKLQESPPGLIVAAFYSSHVNREKLLPILYKTLQLATSNIGVISIEPFIIRCVGALNVNWLELIAKVRCYVAVSLASYITLDDSLRLELAGTAKLCRPKFHLAADVIEQYIGLAYSNNLNKFTYPNLLESSLDDFTIKETLKNTRKLDPNSIKFKLLTQYGSPVDTFVPVKYVVSKRGPLLLAKLEKEDVIDYDYYIKELQQYLKELISLPIYGI